MDWRGKGERGRGSGWRMETEGGRVKGRSEGRHAWGEMSGRGVGRGAAERKVSTALSTPSMLEGIK